MNKFPNDFTYKEYRLKDSKKEVRININNQATHIYNSQKPTINLNFDYFYSSHRILNASSTIPYNLLKKHYKIMAESTFTAHKEYQGTYNNLGS